MTCLVRMLKTSATAAWLFLCPFAALASTFDFQDVTGMKAIYDPQTGHVRFEGLFNVHGIGIGRTENVQFRPEGAATTQAAFSIANEEEVGWLFCDGISGGSFDAGAIFPAGLSDGLSDFYIGVTSIGSGKRITPIPIYTSTASYLPSFDLYAGYYDPPQPPVVEPPVELPPVQLPLDLGPIVVDPVYPVIPVEPALPPVVELPPAEPQVTDLEPADPGMVAQPHIVEVQQEELVLIMPGEPMVPPTEEGLLLGDQSVNLTMDDGLSFFPTGRPISYLNWRNFGGLLEDWSTNELSVNFVNYSAVVDLSALLMTNRALAQFHVEGTSSTLEVHTMGFATLSEASSVQTTIPEPTSSAAMLSALAGLGAFRRCVRRGARPVV